MVKRYPLVGFFLLTYGMTWGLAALYFAFPSQIEATFGKITLSNPAFFLAVYAPAFAALAVIGLTQGLPGVAAYLRRLLHWRIAVRWYLLVLIGIPALIVFGTLISAALGMTPALSLPFSAWYQFVLAALAKLVLDPGPVEELGWRGFALPHLQSKFSALWSSVILGALWGLWHLPAFYVSGLPQGAASYPLFVLSDIFLAVLMTAIYNNTGGSIPLMCLMHWQINDPFLLGSFPHNLPIMVILLAASSTIVTVVAGPQCLGQTKYTKAVPISD